MLLQDLQHEKVITAPKWLPDNVAYLTTMGSHAYGVADQDSDVDIYGFCFPPKEVVFPHLAGIIPGFGDQGEVFNQWQEHHVHHKQKEYDFTVYSIVKYFAQLAQNNPNMIDSLFTPRRCVIHSTSVGEYVRGHRKDFLHKGAWHRFKGYAYSQMQKIEGKTNSKNPKRLKAIEAYGYDVKFGYHLVRLLLEVEQILVEGDMDLERGREQLRAIRRGDMTLDELKKWFADKEGALETVYLESKLQYSPDMELLQAHLYHCLEMHFGSLDKAIKVDNSNKIMLELQRIVRTYG